MKGKMTQIVMPLLVLCIMVSMLAVNVFIADATEPIDECKRIVEPYDLATAEDYINDGKTYTYPTCKTEGYLFAGWYTKETCGKDSYWGKEKPGDTVYALFIPSHVLDVKAQISGNMLDEDKNNDDTASIRFVTTVDSALYKQVGFDVSYTLGTQKTTVIKVSNKVYEKLYAVGDNSKLYEEDGEVYTPQGSFCALATYFKACTVKGLSSSLFSMPFSVKPFWVTVDGSKVYGDTVIRTINDYFLEEDVWVSSGDENAADTEENGTEAKPFASLDYALGMVRNQGIVHVKDSYTAGSEFVWTDHDKTATVTGGTVDFSGVPKITIKDVDTPVLQINDAVSFADTTLKFVNGQHVYANGNKVEIASDVTWDDVNAYVWIYGGAYKTTLKSDTNLVLGTGYYQRIFGGGNYNDVTGDVNVTISGKINTGIDYTEHSTTTTYMAFGGGENGSDVDGDINLSIVNDTVLFNYVYGGGYGSNVTGNITVNFSGKSMSVYGGGRNGYVMGDTKLVMSGENTWVEQLFGGCQGSAMTGNTNVDVQSGTVKRRVYGGCYNELNDLGQWETTNYSVTGHTNVAIGPNATLLRDYNETTFLGTKYLDNGLFSVSRDASVSQNEKGAFIFNDTSYSSAYSGTLGSKKGDTYSDKFPSQSYHYLITTNGNNADGTLGTVTSQNDYIRIQPKHGYSATVIVDGDNAYYTASEAAFKLPTMTSEDEPKNIQVIFSDDFSEVDIAKCEARIGGAYYETLEDAVNAAKALSSKDTTIVTLLKNAEVESAMTISTDVTIQNEVGRSITVYRGAGLATTNMFNVTTKGNLTIKGVGNANSIVLDGRTETEAIANTGRDAATGSTGSMINNYGTLNFENVTAQYVRKTNERGGVINNNFDNSNTNATVNIKNCVFDSNFSKLYGAVLYSKGKSKIEGSTFSNNKSDSNGVALCNHGGSSFVVDDCKFIGNAGNVGGAIWNDQTATIKNSAFQSNTATGNAGAIQNTGSLTIQNCTFDENTSAVHGGAIYTQQNTSIKNCTFTSNTSTSNGGAIVCASYEFTIENSKFDSNTATTNGGAIYNASSSNLTIEGDGTDNSVFVNNKALGTNKDGNFGGGAICLGTGTLNVSNYKFSGNETKANGGAINNRGTSVIVNDCEFTSNKALKNNGHNGYGGAIYMYCGILEIDVDENTHTTFTRNQATNGGATAQRSGTATVHGAEFISNIGDWNGGAVYVNYYEDSNKNKIQATMNLTNCDFDVNTAVSKGGGICNEGGVVSATLCDFTGNQSTGTTETEGEGGAYRQASTGSGMLTKCTFSNNAAANVGGGAIKFNTGTLTIDGCVFSGNVATKGDANGHEIKLSTDPTSENGYYRPTIQNSTFDPSKVRNWAGDSNAYIDGGNNKTPYLDEEQEGGNDEDENIVFP